MLFQIWDKNDGSDATNKLDLSTYILKRLVGITNNVSPKHNLGVFINAVIRYVTLHHSMFGKYEGELMLKPSAFIMNKTSGTFEEFLKREELEPLIPLFVITFSAQGYTYFDDVGALYGLMFNTPTLVVSIALGALGVRMEPYRTYILKDGSTQRRFFILSSLSA